MIVVFNPAAGRRRAQALWHVLDLLLANGVRIQLAERQHPGHAEALARAAVSAGADLVVAAGGDGTIAEVANGLMGSDVKLGVIPIGTANVLAHELDLPFAPIAVAAALAFGRTQKLWPGLACWPNGTRLFVQMLGVGFDAQVVHNLPIPLKHALGRTAYVLQALRDLPRYRFPPITLRIDGMEFRASSVIVSKGRLYAGTHLLAPDARPDERGFCITLFENFGPMATFLYGAALPTGLLPRTPGVRQLRAREIVFTGNLPVPAQVDGDPAGFLPLRITDAAAPINIVMT